MMNKINGGSLNAVIVRIKDGLIDMRKSLLPIFAVVVALVLVLQATFFSSEAIAAPFSKQVEGVKM